jgi:hypothetical protein
MTRKEEIEKGLKYFKDNTDRIVSLYKEMYGETICVTCPGSLKIAFEKMYKDRDKQFSSIRMKRGVVINTTMVNHPEIPKGHFTCKNITDEVANILINHGYASYFII